ncbi:MAG: TPM domain-containing protein [Epsilonproteobacteria bacterium]|nr:TPM domain-containing protein [Campylobacterota bacterium]
MKSYNIQKHKKIFALLVLVLLAVSLNAEKFVFNDGVIVNKTEVKVEEMANELFEKTGIKAYLLAKKNLNGKDIKSYEKEFAKNLKPPFAILTLGVKEQKVDIFNSPDLDSSFDKSTILSPYPWSGSIIPLLTGKKKDVSISAALLNGYSDMSEELAKSKGIKLKSAIGSTNRDIIFFVKISIYLFLLFVILRYFINKMRMKRK